MQIFSQEFINYIFKFWNQYKYFFYFICVILFFITLLFLVSWCIFTSYLLLKYFSNNMNVKYYSLKDYPEDTKRKIEKYGKYKINKMILNGSTNIMGVNLMNIISGFFLKNEVNLFNKMNNQSLEINHFNIILEIEKENQISYLMIEKHLKIKIHENFILNNNEIIHFIDISDKSLDINDLFKKLEEKMGMDLYSWSILNNCAVFIENIYNIIESEIPEIIILHNKFIEYLSYNSELPIYYSDSIIMLVTNLMIFCNKISYFLTLFIFPYFE